jgi:hypothetical protein
VLDDMVVDGNQLDVVTQHAEPPRTPIFWVEESS